MANFNFICGTEFLIGLKRFLLYVLCWHFKQVLIQHSLQYRGKRQASLLFLFFFFPLFACLFKFLPITLWFKLSHVRMGAQALGEHWLGDCTHHSDEEYKWYPSFRQWRDVTQEDKWARVQMLRQEQGSLEVEMLWKFRKDTSTAGSRTLTWGWNPVLMWKRSKGKERSV